MGIDTFEYLYHTALYSLLYMIFERLGSCGNGKTYVLTWRSAISDICIYQRQIGIGRAKLMGVFPRARLSVEFD
jgi:hypothetical protein